MPRWLWRSLAVLAFVLAPMLAFGQSVESVLMPGKVIEGHAKYEQECKKCHLPFDKAAQSRLCMDCHEDVGRDVQARRGFHGRQKEQKECRACHGEHEGRQARIAEFDQRTFDHGQTDFLLKNAHADAKVECKACHEPKRKYREAPSECNGCHRKDDVHKGDLGTACTDCHNGKDWKDARFDHDTTDFALRNKHVDVKCKDCHERPDFKGAKKECVACHRKVDQEKGHKGRYGAKCESCHTDKEWKDIVFNHDKDTKYPLRGKHRSAKCNACHKGPLYEEKLKTRCSACHEKDDVHKGNQGSQCDSCHNEQKWTISDFDHDKSKFPLRDKHKDAKCEDCHKDAKDKDAAYRQKLDVACIACHRKDDDGEKGHKGRFGERCESCHTAQEWKKVIFDHNQDTRYPLREKHAAAKVKCTSCHEGHLYRERLQSDCHSCHKEDDKHKGQLGRRCEDCHSEKDWKGQPYDHNKARFILTGSHVKVKCEDCHKSPAFRDAPRECFACHEKQDDETHQRRLGERCEDCHNTRSWKSWDYSHGRRTKFALEGEHRRVECYACHSRPVARGTKPSLPRACVACHGADDVHAGGFGPQCERCHDSEDWRDIRLGGRAGTGAGTVVAAKRQAGFGAFREENLPVRTSVPVGPSQQ